MPKKSIRLPGFDYRSPGPYFITLVEVRRQHRFGRVHDGMVALSVAGGIVHDTWCNLASLAPHVVMDVFVVMPDHFHAILRFAPSPTSAGSADSLPLHRPPRSLGALVAQFKATTTRLINQVEGRRGEPVWQRNYYERIVRHPQSLDRIRRYILDNPRRASAP